MDFSYDPEQLGNDVKTLLDGAEHALIVAPFVTKVGLLPLIDVVTPGGRIDVVTRWEPLEIKAGVSDPMIIDDVTATGGVVRLVPRLHAKLYLAGKQALVGSANPTGPGLGFTRPANVEVLVVADANGRALRRLLQLIDAVASTTDRDYAMQCVAYADALPESAATVPQNHTAGSAHWIPRTMVPARVFELYFGGVDRDDYRADLDAIGAPPGLSADAFRTNVGLILQQGLVGRIYRECEGMLQWPGVEHMRRLLLNASVEISEDPMTLWNRLLNWFKYYLGATDSSGGGYVQKP